MATITKKRLNERQFGGVPYGNKTVLAFELATIANGSAVGADSAAPIGIADVVRLGILPAGARLNDSQALISTAFSATITGKLGFQYVDGVDVPAVPQDAAYFGTGLVMSAVARLRNVVGKAPVTLPKDAYLIYTNDVAANAKVAKLDVLVDVELVGAP